MQFVSTRGQTAPLGFSDAVATGLAPEGGLFLPETLPQFTAERHHQCRRRKNKRGRP
jgi:threonine synthase